MIVSRAGPAMTHHDVRQNTSTSTDQRAHARQEHIVQHESLGDEGETRVRIQHGHQDRHVGAANGSRGCPSFSETEQCATSKTARCDGGRAWCHGEESAKCGKVGSEE